MGAEGGGLALAAAWLLTYALHSTVLLAASEAVWRSGAGARAGEVAYRAALLGALLTATLSVEAAGPGGVDLAVPAAEAGAGAEGMAPVAARPVMAVGETWASAALWLWLACALPLLGARGAELLRLHLLLRRRVPVERGALAERLRRVAGEMGVREVRLSRLAGLPTPIALARGEICVPPQALAELGAAEQEAMLAHELAHLRRRDPAWLLAAHLLEAALWFQPLNRLARRRLVEAAEEAADRGAVERMGGGLALARCLVVVAAWSTLPARPPLTALAAHVTHFQRRVERLLEDAAPAAEPARGALSAAALGALLCLAAMPPIHVARDAPLRPLASAAPAPDGAARPRADRAWAAREQRLDPQPLFPAVDASIPTGSAYCWAVDGQPANPRCAVVIWTRDRTRLRVPASDLHRVSADGLFRVRTPGGDTLRSLRVSAVDEAGGERLVLMTEQRPDEVPQGTRVAPIPVRG